MRKLFITSIAVITLSGCAHLNYQQARIDKKMEEAGQQCNDKAKAMESHFPQIKNKIVIPSIQPELSLDMLSNEEYATDSEKSEISKVYELHEYCLTAMKNVGVSELSAEYGDVFAEQIALSRENASNLYARKITFGEYNKRSVEIKTLSFKQLGALDSKYREIRMRQSNQLMMQGLQLMAPPQAQSSQNIRCQNIGTFTNCQSW